MIAPTARVHPDARIGPQTVIGEYCVIESDVVIGAFCRLEPYVYVKRWTTLGDRNEISAGTVLGTDPLDKAFRGDRSYLKIGNDNKIREHYTISRGTQPESVTEIGDGNYIMTSGHIAHNCKVGNRTVICSCALLAGYVEVEDEAFISGGVVIHQYSKIGRLAMIGGNTRVNQLTFAVACHKSPPRFWRNYESHETEHRTVAVPGRAPFSPHRHRLCCKWASGITLGSTLFLTTCLWRSRDMPGQRREQCWRGYSGITAYKNDSRPH